MARPVRCSAAARAAAAAVAALLLALVPPAAARRVTPPSVPPTLEVLNHTEGSISLRVCAGSTLAAQGFSVQWILESTWALNGNAWPKRDNDLSICQASFLTSGERTRRRKVTQSRFYLFPYNCTDVTIGDAFLQEPGASFPKIPGGCGTLAINQRWRFRASTKTLRRAPKLLEPSATAEATTLSCRHDKGFSCNAATQDCVLTPLGRECVCKSAAQGYFYESAPGVCKGPLPPTCRRVDGTNWCYEESQCGDSCSGVCARLYLSLNITDAAWFEAQNSQEKCDAIAAALNVTGGAAMAASNTSLSCAEDSPGVRSFKGAGALKGPLVCAADPACPARLRKSMSSFGWYDCEKNAKTRRAICPCDVP